MPGEYLFADGNSEQNKHEFRGATLMDKMTVAFYGAALSGALMIVTFLYSVLLVPAWNWVGTLPGAIRSATSGTPAPSANPAKIATSNFQANSSQSSQAGSPQRTPKPADCGQIIKQIKAGKTITLPQECQPSYQAIKEQEQAKLEEQKQKDELKQKELDRQKEERENAQKLELEREQAQARQRDSDQARAAQQEREQQQRQEEAERRQAAQEEADRRFMQRAGEQRERQRQQELQKRNDAVIKLGNDIRNKIFRKNR